MKKPTSFNQTESFDEKASVEKIINKPSSSSSLNLYLKEYFLRSESRTDSLGRPEGKEDETIIIKLDSIKNELKAEILELSKENLEIKKNLVSLKSQIEDNKIKVDSSLEQHENRVINDSHKLIEKMGISLFYYTGALFFAVIIFNFVLSSSAFIATSLKALVDALFSVASSNPENNWTLSKVVYLIFTLVAPVTFLYVLIKKFHTILVKIKEVILEIPSVVKGFTKD
jgi:hypothetical protein